jgi:hypothetical protein
LPKLTITSHPDAQILLIGGDLKVKRRGVGSLTVDVPPGFYKGKAERGGGTVEQLIELEKDKSVSLPVDSFPAVAPMASLLRGDASVVETLGAQVIAGPPAPWSMALAPHLVPGIIAE